MPVAGSLAVRTESGKIALDRIALDFAGSRVKGAIAVSQGGEQSRLEARIALDQLLVGKLLAPLLDQRLAVAAAAEAAVTGQQSVWPDEPFDFTALDAFEGSVQLTVDRLTLADGIGLNQAAIDIALAKGKVDVTSLEGLGLGGRVSARFRIAKAAAGADVEGGIRLAGGNFDALAGNASAKPRATGSISGELRFAGKGTSPRSVLSVLQGTGMLELGDARLAMLWPGAVGRASEAALKSDPDSLPTVLRQGLAAGLSSGQLQLPATLTLEIADGRLITKPFGADAAEGSAVGSASIDLKTLGFESSWRLESKPAAAAPAGKAPLPGITVTYRGPVAALGGLEPRIDSEALERELAVRRMERDVEELERLRKLDEARRREDAERQRRQLERAPLPMPVPMAPAAPAPRAATPG
jgi:hypothetical protein